MQNRFEKRAAPGATNTERALTKITCLEATLAAPNFNSGERMHIYRLLFLLNRSFHLIVERLEDLDKTGICRSRDLAEMRGLTQEVQLEINTGVLDSLESVENNDWAHFGKIRSAMEKRLRGTK